MTRDLTVRRLNRKWGLVTVPKVGAVRFRASRLWSDIAMATSARVTQRNDQLTCAVLGKFGLRQSATLNPDLHDATQLRRDAERMVAPTMWHVQWDDELFPRVGRFEMLDCLGSQDKQLVAFPGEHGSTPDAAVDGWVAFLVRYLSLPVAIGA